MNEEFADTYTTAKDTYTIYRQFNEHSIAPYRIVTSRRITLNWADSVEEAAQIIALSEMKTRDLPGMKEKLAYSCIDHCGQECYRALWESDTETYLEYLRLPPDVEDGLHYVNRTFFGVSDGPRIRFTLRWDHPVYQKVRAYKPWDGWTPGCSNRIFLLTEDEWEMLMQAEHDYQEEQRRKAEAEKADLASEPSYDPAEITRYRQQYGTSERAWDAGNEQAWALLSGAE